MELRLYQKEALNAIKENVAPGNMLCVEISIGLGRKIIIVKAALAYVDEHKKRVLILSPNQNVCSQLADLSQQENPEMKCAQSFVNNEDGKLFFMTFNDFMEQKEIPDIGLVICDGIHYADIKSKLVDPQSVCLLGFTSQVSGSIQGIFAQANCIYQCTRQKVWDQDHKIHGNEFEEIIAKIFEDCKYKISFSEDVQTAHWDFLAKSDQECLAVFIKYWSARKLSRSDLDRLIDKTVSANIDNDLSYVLVTNAIISEEERHCRKENIIIVDAQNLLYMAHRSNNDKESCLRQFLNYATNEINELKPELDITYKDEDEVTEKEITENLITQYESWIPKQNNYKDYQELCCEALKYLFEDELTLWEKQEHTDENIFVFDLICKIKNCDQGSGTRKEFWEILENYFDTKYIIFEFKDYKDKITQREIFTTEKYLYPRALRSVAIIISVCGADKNAEKAIQGVLREQKKLLLVLDNEDMIRMLYKKNNSDDATSILSEKLDKLLIDLEK